MNQLFIEFTIRATLIAACTGVVLWMAGIRSATVHHKAWTSVMLVMLILPLWIIWGPKAQVGVPPLLLPSAAPVIELLKAPSPTVREASATSAAQETGNGAVGKAWSPARLLLATYITGACALLMRLGIGTVSVRRLVRQSVLEEGHLVSRFCAVPITIGTFRPVMILPANWREWRPRQLDAVLTHESEHARRRDPLVQWLALLHRAVFWFHPLAWWLERRLSFLAERACDDAVLARGHDPRDYSEYLLILERALIRSRRRLSVVGSAMPGSFLPERINQILEGTTLRAVSRKRAACAIAACAISSGFLAAGALVSNTELIAAQSQAPKWGGTWKVNKDKSNFGRDPRILETLGAIESFTLKLEAVPEGVTIATDMVGPALRQHVEFTLKFGAVTDLKNVNPPLAFAYPATLTIVPLRDDSLNLILTYADGSGISSIRFDVSSDGNTLTETTSDLNDARVIFDKQS